MATLVEAAKIGQEPSPVSFKQAATAVFKAPPSVGVKGGPQLILPPPSSVNMSVRSAMELTHVGPQIIRLKDEAPLNTVHESETEL